MTVRQGDESDLRLRPAKEVQAALATIKTAMEADRVPTGANGKLFTTLKTDPIAAREMLLEARMAAQQRLAPDRPETWHLISKDEGDALLKMPKTAYKDLESKTYRDGLKAAADRFYQFYGPKYGKKAFEDAIGFHLSKEGDLKDADRVMARVAAAYATDGKIDRGALARVQNLQEIDRVGRLFEGQGQINPVEYGARRSPLSVMTPQASFGPDGQVQTRGRAANTATTETITNYASREANRPIPTADQVDEVIARPQLQERFDKHFGDGAYARELAKRQKR